MGKYFVINLETDKDGNTSKAIYEYATLKEARAMFYAKLASGLKNENLVLVNNVILNEIGGTEEKAFWKTENIEEA